MGYCYDHVRVRWNAGFWATQRLQGHDRDPHHAYRVSSRRMGYGSLQW